MLQGLAQFCVALLQFLKQPHVFNRDDGLVGEGLEKRNLLVGERSDFCAPDYNNSDCDALAQERSGKKRSTTGLLLKTPSIRVFCFDFRGYVINMDRPPFQNGQSAWQTTTNRYGNSKCGCWQTAILSHSVKTLTDDTHYYRVAGITQPCSALCHYIHYRLNIRRRASDNTQDFARRCLLLQRFL